MTKIEWEGQHRFEMGIDRGVIYPLDGADAVPWVGLINVAENRSREVKSFFVDGVKYLDHHVIGAYSAKVQAYMYPDKLEELTGTTKHAQGVYLHDQMARPFHMCYRTLIGEKAVGVDFGYKLHLIYNVLASMNDITYATLSDKIDPGVFEFELRATPPPVWGIRPTAHLSMHVSLDSSSIPADTLQSITDLLYGTDALDPSFPDLEDLLQMVEGV